MRYRVLTRLNLRRTPNSNRADNIISVLAPNIEVIGIRIENNWLQCQWRTLIGWVVMSDGNGRNYVEKLDELENIELSPITLPTNQLITSLTPQWAFSINDPQAPQGKDPHEIIKYLQVESSPRYRRKGNDTYCNVYAHDFAHLYGAFIPRIWWLNDTPQEKIRYGETVKELTANEINTWFDRFGERFNWIKTTDLDLLQSKVNEGTIGVISTGRPLPRPAHITIVVPETDKHKAIRKQGKVTIPLQSQAGKFNHDYFSQAWYLSRNQINPTFWYLNK